MKLCISHLYYYDFLKEKSELMSHGASVFKSLVWSCFT